MLAKGFYNIIWDFHKHKEVERLLAIIDWIVDTLKWFENIYVKILEGLRSGLGKGKLGEIEAKKEILETMLEEIGDGEGILLRGIFVGVTSVVLSFRKDVMQFNVFMQK